MGARKIDRHRLQEMVRLLRMGRSTRQVAHRLRTGRDTIRTYQRGLVNVLAELAAVLDDLDCVEVLNLDGGSSSALVFG